jgi:two-component system, chemotaxis family, sensor histidine kinase and response regulator WspE
MSDRDMSNFSMMDLFRMEADTQVAVLNENILLLENNPTSPAELESLMRAAHSLKGAARIVGIDAAVKIAHVMEDCFVAAQSGSIVLDSPEKIDVMLRAIDLLARIGQISESEIESWLPNNQSEVDSLEAAILAIINNIQLDIALLPESPVTEDPAVLEAENTGAIALEPPPDLSIAASEINSKLADPTPESLPVVIVEPEIESPAARTIKEDLPMLALFSGEVAAQSVLLNQTLQELKKNPSQYIDLDSLIKAAHLIKGAARIVHFNEIVKLARSLEDTFVALQKHKATLNENQVDILIGAVTLLISMGEVSEIKLEYWLEEKAAEIDNIVGDVNLIPAGLKMQQTAIAVAVASQTTQVTVVNTAPAKQLTPVTETGYRPTTYNFSFQR